MRWADDVRRFFEYSYEKPELLYEYSGKLPDVYFNFSAFFSRRVAFSGVRAYGKLLQNPELVFSRLLVGIGLAYYQVRLVHDAALYDQPQGSYVEIYLAHLFGCLEEGGQRLETEIADGVETRVRADARDALDFRLRYVRQGVQCIDELS